MTAPTTGQLLDILLESVPEEPCVFGWERHDDGVHLAVAPMVHDDRCAAASLFGFRAPPSWHALGVVLVGRARRIDDDGTAGEVLAPDVRTATVIDRSGRLSERLNGFDPGTFAQLLGSEDGSADHDSDLHPILRSQTGPHGLMVDALCCALGRPCLGDTPPIAHYVLSLWATSIHQGVAEGERPGWREMVQLCPSVPEDPDAIRPVPTTAEIASLIVETSQRLSWKRMRRRVARGATTAIRLSAEEADWMDETLFARWTLGALTSPLAFANALTKANPHMGRNFHEVMDGVVETW